MYIEFCELGALDGIMMELDRPLTEPQIKYICRLLQQPNIEIKTRMNK